MLVEDVDPLLKSLYELISSGRLSPGQRVDQREIADLLNVSRTPLREALRALAADGVLRHTPNHGYEVAKLSATDLLQYYSLRGFLESQLLQTMIWPDADQLAELIEANKECAAASDAGHLGQLIGANRHFHFLMFSWSPLTILAVEVVRIWRVSEAYRAFHLSDPVRRGPALDDHDQMIEAIKAKDRMRLVALMDSHRARTRQMLEDMVRSSPQSPVLWLPI